MNDKQELRARIERAKIQSTRMAEAESRWKHTKMLDAFDGDISRREACVCAMENQMGYNALMGYDPCFRRVSVPIVRRIFNNTKSNIVSRHEGYKLNEQCVAMPPVALDCGKGMTGDLLHLSFLGKDFIEVTSGYSQMHYEAEELSVLSERLAVFVDDLATKVKDFIFLGIGYYTSKENIQQMMVFADVPERS